MPPVPVTTAPPAPASVSGGKVFSAALVIAVTALAAYANSFSAPFVFDDQAAITNNPGIQKLWPLGDVLFPPNDIVSGTMGRPVENLSLAVNYALGGLDVRGYHAVNLLIHILAGWTLFGLVRRTLELPSLRGRFGCAALPLAFSIALLWTLHPLQTETVTGVVQRNESLMALFYLLTLYCFVRAPQSPRPAWWQAGAVLACGLGMASKEVMVSAPLVVLLYDRTFIAGTFREVLKIRWKFYSSLAATWVLLAALVLRAHQRGDTVGFGLGVPWWAYALKQCAAIPHYLWLSVWPHPLIVDYGSAIVTDPLTVAPQILFLSALVGGTAYALWRHPMAGFLGAWFFLILAPSSSVLPLTTQTMAEHRMYLPLAAVIVFVILSSYQLFVRRIFAPAIIVSAVFVGLTFLRNQDYQSALVLWQKTAAAQPENARAHENYAVALLDAQRLAESADESRRALKLKPDYAEAENNLGNVLAQLNQPAAAAPYFSRAVAGLRFPREKALAYFNLGNTLGALSRLDEALAAYTQSITLQPAYAPAHNLRGYVLEKMGRYADAIAEYEQALKLQPDYPQCAENLAVARKQLGQGQL